MSESKGLPGKYSRLFVLIAIVVWLVFVITQDLTKSWNIFVAVMGFSAVVFVHECGHFLVAKVSNIKVETFSIFLPPVLLGVRRTENGFRFRILPKFFPKENDPAGEGHLSFTIGKKGKAGETEYRIGLIPVAGYVKMLGQEDVGADKPSDDPRSFLNKGICVRMAVIAAGVIFNVIAAILIMTVVYLVGINRIPAVIGGVIPNSPAAQAGLRAGDEIIEIAGKNDNLDFEDIVLAPALSDVNESVPLKVRHEDGSVEDFSIVAREMLGMPVRLFGFYPPTSLTIGSEAVGDDTERKGLQSNDLIISVNGQKVGRYWELEKIVSNSITPSILLSAERRKEDTEYVKRVESEIKLSLSPYVSYKVESDSDLGHIYSMVPRLRVEAVVADVNLVEGDIILATGSVENPTYKELREITTEYADKKLPINVLRKDANGVERTITVTVVPKRRRGTDRVEIGFAAALDAEHAVVAKTIAVNGLGDGFTIPRGAVITEVDGEKVSSFYDIIQIIQRNCGHRISLEYRLNEETAGSVAFVAGDGEDLITVKSRFAESISFRQMKRLYKADGLGEALVMGGKRSIRLVVRTYVTLKQLLARNVSIDAMSGPVGIATMTYHALESSFVSFLYFLAFISANLAVINFLPIPVVDGGVFILLIVEKIKGSPVNVKVQEIITVAGLGLIGMAFVYLTYQDILRLIFGWR